MIRSIEDLAALSERAADSDREEGITVEIAGLSPDRARSWQQKLERYFFSCGCEAGAALLLLSVFGYLAVLAWRPEGFSNISWLDGVRGLGLAVVAALVGKVIGLAYSRVRLRKAVKELGIELQTRVVETTRAPHPPATGAE